MPFSRETTLYTANRILAALRPEELARVKPHLEHVRLTQGATLYSAGDTVRRVYFINAGMVSLVAVTADGSATEVGMIGDEGMAGIAAVLKNDTSPYDVVVQLAGAALRMRADLLKVEFERRGVLHDMLLRYMHMLLKQISQSAVCNRFHTVEERLCRWLLISSDRSHLSTLFLTQEFLSQMIGAPRTSVTITARALQRQGFINYSRGKIQILDREAMTAASCECYGVVAEEMKHMYAA
jgi:CRP-like cAMP-binding protein